MLPGCWRSPPPRRETAGCSGTIWAPDRHCCSLPHCRRSGRETTATASARGRPEAEVGRRERQAVTCPVVRGWGSFVDTPMGVSARRLVGCPAAVVGGVTRINTGGIPPIRHKAMHPDKPKDDDTAARMRRRRGVLLAVLFRRRSGSRLRDLGWRCDVRQLRRPRRGGSEIRVHRLGRDRCADGMRFAVATSQDDWNCPSHGCGDPSAAVAPHSWPLSAIRDTHLPCRVHSRSIRGAGRAAQSTPSAVAARRRPPHRSSWNSSALALGPAASGSHHFTRDTLSSAFQLSSALQLTGPAPGWALPGSLAHC